MFTLYMIYVQLDMRVCTCVRACVHLRVRVRVRAYVNEYILSRIGEIILRVVS
jgi:hypothetical protein